MVVKPGNRFERGQFHGLLGLSWRLAINEFGLIPAIDRLGQNVVVAVALAAHRVVERMELLARMVWKVLGASAA